MAINIKNNMKKANLSLQVVIVAVLVLLVLIVLSVIFSVKMGAFNKSLRHCDTICKSTIQACQDEGYEIPIVWSSCEDTKGNKFKGQAYCCSYKNQE